MEISDFPIEALKAFVTGGDSPLPHISYLVAKACL